MATNLSGMSSVWDTLMNQGGAQGGMSDDEMLARKKKIMAAGGTDQQGQSAAQWLFGGRLNAGGMPRG